VSSIMDRLKDVEKKSSSGGGGPERTGDTPLRIADCRMMDRKSQTENPKSEIRNPKSRVRRAIAGLVVIFAVFLVWRTWLRESPSPSGKPTPAHSVSLRQPRRIAPGRAGNESPAALFEPEVSVRPEQKQPTAPLPAAGEPVAGAVSAASLEMGKVVRALTGPDQTMPSRQTPASRSAEAPPAGEETRPGDRPTTPAEVRAEAPAAQILTTEEDERTKTFLLNLKVSGVYTDANGYVALINGRQFQKGDKIEQIKVMTIASGRITFAYKGKRYHLPIR